MLKADMLLSTGFMASLLLLVAPRAQSVAMVVVAGLLLSASDVLGLDSRRQADANASAGG